MKRNLLGYQQYSGDWGTNAWYRRLNAWKGDYEGFMNANQVTPRIWVGGALEASDIPALLDAGITHVCDVTTHDDDGFLRGATGSKQINVLWLNTGDDGQDKTAVYKPIAPWFLGAWADPHNRFIFHCDAGINRGPSGCYMALRLLEHSPVEAQQLIRTARPIVGLHYMPDVERALAELGYS
jgi:hypothetical protein